MRPVQETKLSLLMPQGSCPTFQP